MFRVETEVAFLHFVGFLEFLQLKMKVVVLT